MDAYDIADLMDRNLLLHQKEVFKVFNTGDEADRLYAAIYLLSSKSISIDTALNIISDNCGSKSTRLAWEMSARYINDKESNIFSDKVNIFEKPPAVLTTFLNLCPLFVRKNDSKIATQIIERFIESGNDNEDLKMAVEAIRDKFSLSD